MGSYCLIYPRVIPSICYNEFGKTALRFAAPSSWNHLKLKERVSLDECKAALNDLNSVKSVNVLPEYDH